MIIIDYSPNVYIIKQNETSAAQGLEFQLVNQNFVNSQGKKSF